MKRETILATANSWNSKWRHVSNLFYFATSWHCPFHSISRARHSHTVVQRFRSSQQRHGTFANFVRFSRHCASSKRTKNATKNVYQVSLNVNEFNAKNKWFLIQANVAQRNRTRNDIEWTTRTAEKTKTTRIKSTNENSEREEWRKKKRHRNNNKRS